MKRSGCILLSAVLFVSGFWSSGSAAMVEEAAEGHLSWLSIGGDLRVRHDVLRGHARAYTQITLPGGVPTFTPMSAQTIKNNSLLTNRLGVNIQAKVLEGISFKSRLVMQKAYGMADSGPVLGGNFSDRMAIFDGTKGHVAEGNTLLVDYAYADWSNIAGKPIWFSAGRRPSTGGSPTQFRRNAELDGVSGTMGLLTDYAFDGFTLGAAPDIAKLPGFAAKLCYGRAYQTGYQSAQAVSALDNTDMLGIVVVPMETDNTRLELQFQHGYHLMDQIPGPNVAANLGDMENLGIGATHVLRKAGPGDLNVFAFGGWSRTMPSDETSLLGAGLLHSGTKEKHGGYAAYLGARYDLPSRTKIGLEYNMGSRYWLSFTPAADDIWTSKLGTRGSVYEAYVIQELSRDPVSLLGKTFFRLGYQYYNFKYTGSNGWVGYPVPIKDVTAATPQFLAPVENAYDVYATFDVHF